jgi:23S rRNA (uracil1939-C5)-methyltransferase
MAHGGSAVGRHDGRAIFVPYAIPGERVRARITQDKGRFANAEAVEVLDASEARVIPRCPHFGSCGGCHVQYIDYGAQLTFKQQVVADQLARIGGLRDVTVHPTIPSPDPWNYRSHVTFHVTDERRLGFVATDNRTVIPIEECHIIHPELVEMFDAMKTKQFTPGERVRLQVGTDGEEPSPPTPLPEGEGSKSRDVRYTIKEHSFQVSTGSFFQVNLPQAETLVDLVLDRLRLQGEERVLDLYSGVGLFTAFLAERAAYVTAVESYPPAVQDALANLEGFDNVEIMEGPVEEALDALEGRYDAVVTDPPRTGMEQGALDTLAALAPAQIVYVSCDPATLARDAKRLTNNGYRLLDVQPVDMFPQTYHIEALAAFEKDR